MLEADMEEGTTTTTSAPAGETPPPAKPAASNGNGAAPATSDSKKMVPESDLMAVKGQFKDLEAKIKEAETTAANWQGKAQTSEAQLAKLQSDLQALQTASDELAKLKAKSEGDSKSLESATKRTLDLTKTLIKVRFPNLPEDKYKDKTQAQLDMLLDVLGDVASGNGRGSFDSGNGSGNNSFSGTTPAERALEASHRELEKLRAKK